MSDNAYLKYSKLSQRLIWTLGILKAMNWRAPFIPGVIDSRTIVNLRINN